MPPPPGITTGALLSTDGFNASEWKLPANATLAETGITITSEKNNPVLHYTPALAGDILVQVRLQKVDSNHNVRLAINNHVALVFNRQLGKLLLSPMEKSVPKGTPLFELAYPNHRLPAPNPADFVLTLTLRGDKIHVWIDGREVMPDTAIPGLAAPWKLSFGSGWQSHWTIAGFAVTSLKSKM